MSGLEERREKKRLAKQKERAKKKASGEIVDLVDGKRRVLINLCNGKKVRISSIVKYSIKLDEIKCDKSLIHPEILEYFNQLTLKKDPPKMLNKIEKCKEIYRCKIRRSLCKYVDK